ncbi:glycosyltransferase [Orrella marina]|uniref:glycosyltransferase n=1 Tax=Orrella marina TaxID=2163011 RepID=UPI00131F2101|nr:glycosyltransferase family 2 protein [Orrella marina]
MQGLDQCPDPTSGLRRDPEDFQDSQDSTELRISIIVPTYNKATHLARLLPSILAQTVSPQDYEVIIVDDGSTDETPTVAQAFKDQFTHFLYVRQENKGIGGARNTGLKYARGELISFLADDYVLAPAYLEKLSAQFDNPEVQGVRPLFDSLGRTAVEMAVFTLLMSGMKRQHMASKQLLHAPLSVHAWGGAAMTRRCLFEQHGPFLETFATGEDSEYATRLDRSGIRIHVYNEVLFQIKNRTAFLDACRRMHQYAVNGVLIRQQFYGVQALRPARRRPLPVRLAGLVVNPVINTFLCTDSFLQALRVAPLTLTMTLSAIAGTYRTRWQLRRRGVAAYRPPTSASISALSAESVANRVPDADSQVSQVAPISPIAPSTSVATVTTVSSAVPPVK